MKLKRLLAILLVTVLCVSLLSVTAHAEGDGPSIAEDYTVDLTGSEPVALPEDLINVLAELSVEKNWGNYNNDNYYLNLNGGGEDDVLLDMEAGTAQRLSGAEELGTSVIKSLQYGGYESVTFKFLYTVTFVNEDGGDGFKRS